MKFRFLNTAFAVVILLASCLVNVANAGIIYTVQEDFNLTISDSIVDHYSNTEYQFFNSDIEMSAVLGETSYQSTAYLDSNIVSGGNFYCAGCNGSFILDFTSTSIGNDKGVFGVGFNYFNQGAPLYHAFITFGDGSTEDILLEQVFHIPDDFRGFLGITSEVGISSISLGLENGATTTEGAFGIDNLTIGAHTSVPEPPTLIIFALSIMGLASRRFKKQ